MRLSESQIIYDAGMEGYRLEGATFIEGLPGIGMVARVAIAYIIGKIKTKRLCRIYSPHYPSIAYVSDGKILLNFTDIYAAEEPAPTLILYGSAQPSSSYGQYEFCDKVIDTVIKHGAARVFTVGGLGGKEKISARREVYCSSTKKGCVEKYMEIVGGQLYNGQIIGAAGLLMSLAGRRDLDNMGMLVEISEATPDYYAARRAVIALSQLAGLGLGEPDIDEVAKVSTATIARLES